MFLYDLDAFVCIFIYIFFTFFFLLICVHDLMQIHLLYLQGGPQNSKPLPNYQCLIVLKPVNEVSIFGQLKV